MNRSPVQRAVAAVWDCVVIGFWTGLFAGLILTAVLLAAINDWYGLINY